uniref:Uncharacterized protein n=1 Tax=Cacopsylla melanoneura TaxID=428564 RepID=A0A8D8T8T3_9HEMI
MDSMDTRLTILAGKHVFSDLRWHVSGLDECFLTLLLVCAYVTEPPNLWILLVCRETKMLHLPRNHHFPILACTYNVLFTSWPLPLTFAFPVHFPSIPIGGDRGQYIHK